MSLSGSAALEAAEAADSGKAEGTGSGAGALLGVPVAIKDLIDVGGMRTTAASRVLEDASPAAEDAECVRRLRAAGAIVLGKTNLHEFAYGGSGAISAYGSGAESARPSKGVRRVVLGLGGSRGGGNVFWRPGNRHSGLRAVTGGVLRGGGVQADVGHGFQWRE